MDGSIGLFGAFGVRRLQDYMVLLEVFFLVSVFFHNYWAPCWTVRPPACSPTEICCNKSDSKFFPCCPSRGRGARNSAGSIEDLFRTSPP
ncbi:NT-3 growth factor receptor-like isoform X1 [Lates japonicus]|uniref:NT-3 growth factor receptor-like isoform X1 n=1 Tax=Lates japonicus TaxID=270547 RepID=A0AAD3N3V3_LATJO|nr:NT-3 growth factor receptor-like isoform X1 [Lates japonicus]